MKNNKALLWLLAALFLTIRAKEEAKGKSEKKEGGEGKAEGKEGGEGVKGEIGGDEEFKLLSKIANGIVGLMIIVYLAFFLALAIGYGCNYCITRFGIHQANKDRIKKRLLDDDDDCHDINPRPMESSRS